MNQRLTILLICTALALAAAVSCMSGSGDFPEETQQCPDCGDDDDGGDDDAGRDDDDAADDDVTDDDAADDDDDAFDDDDDDDTVAPPDCGAMMDIIYTDCKLEVAEGTGKRLTENEAEELCEAGGGFWECAEACRLADDDCTVFTECFDACPGQYNLL